MTPHWQATILAGILVAMVTPALADVPPPDSPAARKEAEHLNRLPPVTPPPVVRIDPSGRKEVGHASYYSRRFANRRMADGRRMNPQSNAAASKSLPLGTMAKVTNLKNGKTVTVKVEDRGPYVKGRVVDLAPAAADKLDIKKDGVAPVEVKPVTVPQPDGAVKLGAGAAGSSPEEIARDTDATKELIGAKPTETSER
jgi:rare lipoprotein A